MRFEDYKEISKRNYDMFEVTEEQRTNRLKSASIDAVADVIKCLQSSECNNTFVTFLESAVRFRAEDNGVELHSHEVHEIIEIAFYTNYSALEVTDAYLIDNELV